MFPISRLSSILLLSSLIPVSHAQSSVGFHVIRAKAIFNHAAAAPASKSSSTTATTGNNGILYNGGPVMHSPRGVNVYNIWYGNWSNDSTPFILTEFINELGGSTYYNITTTYYDLDKNGSKDPVRNRVTYAGSISDHYSFGTVLSDNDVGLLIQNAVTSGKLPADPNGVYFVISSADVTESSGYCSLYCGFHGYQPVAGLNVNVGQCGDSTSGCLLGAYVGGAASCPTQCTWQGIVPGPAPNGNAAADGMVATVSHELMETATDPWGTGWVNADGSEMADLCDGVLGPLKTLPNGQDFDLALGDDHYLTSERWVNALGGYCGMHWINGDR